jgi:hypothetical protein
MFFFFIGGVQPKEEILDQGPLRCPRCGRVSARIQRINQYLSLFFIPLFPIKKGQPFLVCTRCGYARPVSGGQALREAPREDYPGWQEELDEEEGVRRCPYCGAEVEPEFEYCPYCGMRLGD